MLPPHPVVSSDLCCSEIYSETYEHTGISSLVQYGWTGTCERLTHSEAGSLLRPRLTGATIEVLLAVFVSE